MLFVNLPSQADKRNLKDRGEHKSVHSHSATTQASAAPGTHAIICGQPKILNIQQQQVVNVTNSQHNRMDFNKGIINLNELNMNASEFSNLLIGKAQLQSDVTHTGLQTGPHQAASDKSVSESTAPAGQSFSCLPLFHQHLQQTEKMPKLVKEQSQNHSLSLAEELLMLSKIKLPIFCGKSDEKSPYEYLRQIKHQAEAH
jgi:hypothetical protein